MSDDLLYTRCLVSERTAPFQPTLESVHWRAGAHQLLHLEGHAASDGSLKHKHRAGGQCGWSVAGRSGGSEIVIWGSMPCSLPVHKKILRAELWGLLQSLRHCLPPITVHVDCEAVLTMLARGKKCCTAARTRHADVWRRIWQCIDDIGLGAHGAVFAKCAAHLSQARRAELPPFQAHVSELNEVADSWAKHGADMDVPVQWHVQALKDQQAQVKSLAKLMAAVEQATRDGFGGHIDTLSAESSRGTEGLRPPRCKRTPKAKPPEHPHMLRYAHGVLMCDVCPRKATTFKGKARMQREDCRRMYKYDAAVGARGRRGGHRCHLGRLVWRTGAWTWCHRCGVHSMHKVIGLRTVCRGRFVNTQAKVRRDRLRQGRHPYSDVWLGVEATPLPRRASTLSANTASSPQPPQAHDPALTRASKASAADTSAHAADTSATAVDAHANANAADAHASTSNAGRELRKRIRSKRPLQLCGWYSSACTPLTPSSSCQHEACGIESRKVRRRVHGKQPPHAADGLDPSAADPDSSVHGCKDVTIADCSAAVEPFARDSWRATELAEVGLASTPDCMQQRSDACSDGAYLSEQALDRPRVASHDLARRGGQATWSDSTRLATSADLSGSGGGGGSGRQEVHEVQVGRSTHRPPPDLRARSLPPELRTAWQRRLEKWREQRRRKHQETEEECARSAKKVCHDLASAC